MENQQQHVGNDANHTIAITGGHISPALAAIEALSEQNYHILFFGRAHTFSQDSSPSFELQLLEKNPQVDFISIETGRFTAGISLFSYPKEFKKTLKAIQAAKRALQQTKPKMVLSFGGYLAVPVVLAAKMLHIPVYLHEQTIHPGKANKFLSSFAKKIFTAFPEAVSAFPAKKTECIGNPYASEFLNPKKPAWFPNTDKPIILVMGGSGGSHEINSLIEQSLPALTKSFVVIHQTGLSAYNDYERLAKKVSASYFVFAHLQPQELAYCMRHAHCTVTRTGANTFFLLLFYRTPSILLPLGISANGEQQAQARIIAKHNGGVLFSDNLTQTVQQVLAHRDAHQTGYASLAMYASLLIDGKTFIHALGL